MFSKWRKLRVPKQDQSRDVSAVPAVVASFMQKPDAAQQDRLVVPNGPVEVW